jgi:hypothetical protein
MPGGKAGFVQPPTFTDDPPSPVPSDRAWIGVYGNEYGSTSRKGIRHNVNSHALTGKPGPAREDLLDLRPLPDPVYL